MLRSFVVEAPQMNSYRWKYNGDGPFWALGDGKPMLQPHGFLGRKRVVHEIFLVFLVFDMRL